MLAIRLTIPSKPYFDEIHYVPAARVLMALTQPANVEHPMLGKELLALGMRLFGDNAFGWRVFPALFGTLGLFAAMRALWFASGSRFASLAIGVLIATGARVEILWGYLFGGALMVFAAIVEGVIGVSAECVGLEDVARPMGRVGG